MSFQQLSNQLATANRDIHSIEGQIHTIDKHIATKQRELSTIMERMSKERDLKKIPAHLKNQSRKNEEISKLEKDKSTKSKALADKITKRNNLQAQLNKEEQKEREKSKKEQKELLSLQQEISREMERQRNISLSFADTFRSASERKEYDVFISHASEDKEDFVRQFAASLKAKGLRVWYDEFELRIGDSLRRSIDNGLRSSRYGIVVLSEPFFNKEWPQRELDGLFAREVNGEKVILPIWHKISKDEVIKYSPMIADMLALNTAMFTIEEIAIKIAERIVAE